MNKLLLLGVFFFSACNDLPREENSEPARVLQGKIVKRLSDQGISDAWGITKRNGKFIIRSQSGVILVPDERGEALSRSTEVEEKGVILYDFSSNRLTEYSVERGNEIKSEPVKLPLAQQHLAAIKGMNFTISTGIYEDGRYLYCTDTGEAKYFVSYPTHSDYPEMTEKVKAILYASSVLRIRPDERAFVCADMYSETIDFCRVTNGHIDLVKRLCLHAPDIRVQGQSRSKICYTKENRMGFSDVAVSENRVFAIHSGKSFREAGSSFSACEELFVFDWEGNLIDTYKLPAPVTSIDYNSSENAIYAVAYGQEVSLLKIKLPGEE